MISNQVVAIHLLGSFLQTIRNGRSNFSGEESPRSMVVESAKSNDKGSSSSTKVDILQEINFLLSRMTRIRKMFGRGNKWNATQ
mmetsp:Transcript_46204/g.51669  ORF Transcript_46204/g.51669 Transcript_46204/m.51669 type:complete len:84 (-) Transcript_46204:561-812(-)